MMHVVVIMEKKLLAWNVNVYTCDEELNFFSFSLVKVKVFKQYL
jgi:hypothetical protein